MPAEVRVPIQHETDIVTARQKGRELAAARGFSLTQQTLIATAISEVARNILVYARQGEIVLATTLDDRGCPCLSVVARDEGPGIQDVDAAMQDGYSTSRGLGMGLPGAKRLMDKFKLISVLGKGTTVTMEKCIR